MAVPKQRQSRSRTRKRRAQHRAPQPGVYSICETCDEPVLRHRVCENCASEKPAGGTASND